MQKSSRADFFIFYFSRQQDKRNVALGRIHSIKKKGFDGEGNHIGVREKLKRKMERDATLPADKLLKAELRVKGNKNKQQ